MAPACLASSFLNLIRLFFLFNSELVHRGTFIFYIILKKKERDFKQSSGKISSRQCNENQYEPCCCRVKSECRFSSSFDVVVTHKGEEEMWIIYKRSTPIYTQFPSAAMGLFTQFSKKNCKRSINSTWRLYSHRFFHSSTTARSRPGPATRLFDWQFLSKGTSTWQRAV